METPKKVHGVKVEDVKTADGEVVASVYALHDAEVCDKQSSQQSARAAVDKKGPSKVVSDAYRDGYDAIFGKREVFQS